MEDAVVRMCRRNRKTRRKAVHYRYVLNLVNQDCARVTGKADYGQKDSV